MHAPIRGRKFFCPDRYAIHHCGSTRHPIFRMLVCLVVLFISHAAIVFADFSLTPRLTIGTEYTDNVNLVPEGEEYEVTTLVSPGIDMALTGRRGAVTIGYSPTYATYTRFPEYTNWRHDASLDAFLEIARGTRLEVSNAFLYTEDPASDSGLFTEEPVSDVDTDNTIRRGREPYTTNTASIGMVGQFGAESDAEIRYEYYVLENDDPTIEDSSYHRPMGRVTYWFVPNRYAVEMAGEYTVSDFDVSEDYEELIGRLRLIKRFSRHFDLYLEYEHETIDYLADGVDYNVYSPTVGFEWAEQADTSFAASFGYFYRKEDIPSGSGDSEDDDGIVASASLTHDWTAGGSFAFSGSIGQDRASFGAENLGFNTFYEVSGTVSYPLARRMAGNLTAGYRGDNYIDEDPDREDTTWRAGAGLAYQLRPWITINLDYLYREVDSNIDINDYTENRAALSMTLTPRQAIRF